MKGGISLDCYSEDKNNGERNLCIFNGALERGYPLEVMGTDGTSNVFLSGWSLSL